MQPEYEQRLHDAALALAAGGHDIANLLTVIEGNLHLLVTGGGSIPPEVLIAAEAATEARKLISRLLGNRAAPPAATTPVAALVRTAVTMLRPIWNAAPISLQISGELEGQPALLMPTDAAQRVLVNVLLNALTALDGEGEIRIDVSAADGLVVIQLADSGHGIEPTVEPVLFRPFASGRNSGTGLGLAGSRYLVEQSGGSLQIESVRGSGTVVTIRIPHI